MSDDQTQKKTSLGKKLALMFSVFLVGLLLIEGAVRVRQYLKHGTTDTTVFANAVDEATGLSIPKPNSVTGGIKISKRGFRNADIEDPKPADRIRLAFLGASTTFCAEASSNETTWAHRVAAELGKAHKGKTFDYINAGVPGYTTEQSVPNLNSRVAPLQPDVLLIYHGTNDLSSDSREQAQAQGVFEGKAEDPSWFAGVSLTWYLIEKNLQVAKRQKMAQESQGRLKFDLDAAAAAFKTRLTALVVAAKKKAPVVGLITFSPKVRREMDEKTRLDACNTSLFYMPYMTVDALLDGFDRYNQIIVDVAKEQGVLLIDGEFEIPGDDTHFNDSVHLKDAGCKKMAERVVKRLAAAPAFQALLQ